jgi:hypothetical protein
VRIENVLLATNFAMDSAVVARARPSFEALVSKAGGELKSVAVPDEAPAEIPRLIHVASTFVLVLSFQRLELTITPPHHLRSDLDALGRYVWGLIGDVYLPMAGFFGENYEWSGLVYHLRYPSGVSKASALDVIKPIAEKLVNVPFSGPLVTFNLQIGFQQGSFYKNFLVQGYSLETVLMNNGKRSPQSGVASEAGVEISFDLNTRPIQKRSAVIDDVKLLFSEATAQLPTVAAQLDLKL